MKFKQKHVSFLVGLAQHGGDICPEQSNNAPPGFRVRGGQKCDEYLLGIQQTQTDRRVG